MGRVGEDLAAGLYERIGFAILERNYRCSHGEIDIVARRGGLVVFCEVKTRATDYFGEPSEAVAGPKQARVRRLAGHWLKESRPGSTDVRFDVVSVMVRDGRAQVKHIPNAF